MSRLDDILRNVKATIKTALHKEVDQAVNQGLTNAANAIANSKGSKTVSFDRLPENLAELKALPGTDLHDPYYVAGLTILALCEFPKDQEACFAMLDYLKGPRPLTNLEKSFINDRFMDGVDYVPRSYIAGSSPENDYTPATPYRITVKELAHSRDNIGDGYLRLFIASSGADSERFLDLRYKPSTDQWFLWEFPGILLGIRTPVSVDPWA